MKNNLEKLRKFRDFLIKHGRHLNTGRSPVFVLGSLIAGVALIISGILLEPKTAGGRICIVVGLAAAIINAVQLIYKKYI